MFRIFLVVFFATLSNTVFGKDVSITCLGKGVYSKLTTKSNNKYNIEIEQEIVFLENELVFTNINLIGNFVGTGIEKEIIFNQGIKGDDYEMKKVIINKNKISIIIYLLEKTLKMSLVRRGQIQFDVSRTTGKYEFYADYPTNSHLIKDGEEIGNHVYHLNGECKKTNNKF